MGWTLGSLAFKNKHKLGETVSGEQGDLAVSPGGGGGGGVCDGALRG